jgi:Fe-S cluster assembly ATP-binding protein
VQPDHVHVLFEGRIVKSGSKELAFELEQKGYGWLERELGNGENGTARS